VGKTLIRNGKAGADDWTFDRLAADGIEVAEFLRQHLGQDKVILLAHSQGTTMACTPDWLGTSFDLPVLLLHGDQDMHAVTAVAQEYFASIEAPAKDLVLLDGLGHMAPFVRPDLIETELITRIRPLATRACRA